MRRDHTLHTVSLRDGSSCHLTGSPHRVTEETSLRVCCEGIVLIGLSAVGRPALLSVSGTIPWAEVLGTQKEESKLKSRVHPLLPVPGPMSSHRDRLCPWKPSALLCQVSLCSIETVTDSHSSLLLPGQTGRLQPKSQTWLP